MAVMGVRTVLALHVGGGGMGLGSGDWTGWHSDAQSQRSLNLPGPQLPVCEAGVVRAWSVYDKG